MAKNIVFLSDGTGNKIKTGVDGAPTGTNVVRLKQMIPNDLAEGQIVEYDAGVGTRESVRGRTWTVRTTKRFLGLAFGYGIKKNVRDAYEFIMRNYEPGDRIYIFGFSRGAYTARAIAGMIRFVGLLPPDGSDEKVKEAFKLFWRREQKSPDDFDKADAWTEANGRPDFDKRAHDAIHFVGVWDTVKAVGWIRNRLVLAWTRKLPNVAHVWHAVSIDEKRAQFKANLLELDASRDVNEVWFAGVHSDVGGTFSDHRLADITLRWMTRAAAANDLVMKDGELAQLDTLVNIDSALGTPRTMGRFWKLLGRKQRTIEPDDASIHHSVRIRSQKMDYEPPLPPDHTFVDTNWPN